jgi:hypothetical protein
LNTGNVSRRDAIFQEKSQAQMISIHIPTQFMLQSIKQIIKIEESQPGKR